MMNVAIYTLFVGIFLFEWLYSSLGIGVRQITWIPELFSILVACYIPAKIAFQRKMNIPSKYIIIFIIYIVNSLFGLMITEVKTGTVISGMRIYFTFIPVFLLPMIHKFTEKQFTLFSKVILLFAVIQLPIGIWQRLTSSGLTGDVVGGTLGRNTSGILSVFLLSVIAVLITSYLKKKMSFWTFTALSLICFIPTCINETKITVFLLPITILFPMILSNIGSRKRSLFRTVFLGALSCVMVSVFILTYDQLIQKRRPGFSIVNFMSNDKMVKKYSNVRITGITSAIERSGENLKNFVFGVGIGNASDSFSEKMIGNFYEKHAKENPIKVSISIMLWEMGFFGTSLYLLIIAFIIGDAISLIKRDDMIGVLSISVVTFAVLFICALFYTQPLNSIVLVYCFYLFAGFIVNEKYVQKVNY